MPAKISISLVLALLVLALAGGNPFLQPPARAVSAPAPAPVPLVAGSGLVRLADRDLGDRNFVDGDFVDGDFGSNATRDDLDAKFVQSEECPDPALRSQVVAVRHDASGRPVWVLQDGRAVRRNPAHDPRRPKLQPLLLVESPPAAPPRRR